MAQRHSRGISPEPVNPKRQRRGPSMRPAAGKGGITTINGREYWGGRHSSLHADVLGNKVGGRSRPHDYERAPGREHVTF